MTKEVIEQLKADEGFSDTPYRCTANKLTIGYGKQVDFLNITQEEAEKWLKEDVGKIEKKLVNKFWWYMGCPEQVKIVVISMCYQLGVSGFSKFRKTIDLIAKKEYKKASIEMLDSRWATQTPNRAKRLSNRLNKLGD